VRELTPAGEQPLEDFMLPNYMALLSELARELGEDQVAKIPENERANAVRRLLTTKHALLLIDNLETQDALALLAELAKTNRHLAAAGEAGWQTLYEITTGNPLLLRWTVGQLGRRGSQCRTVAEACDYVQHAPPGNDPLDYIFGDLLDTFTPSETAVLAALTHFTQPAQVQWIADVAQLAASQAQTALEDLADRALLVGDPAAQAFILPPLTAQFLRAKRPEAVAQSGDRLADRAYALALEHGYQEYDRFPTLEAEWPTLAAALPRLVHGENERLQTLCAALDNFLDFSGRWDDWLWLSQQAEAKALGANDLDNAGWRAYQAGWMYHLRGQAVEILACADRAEAHWRAVKAGAWQQARAIRLRGLGYRIQKDYAAAIAAFQQALGLQRALNSESEDVAGILNSLAAVERLSGDYAAAERDYTEALRIAKQVNYPEAVAGIPSNLAEIALDREDWPAAAQLAREALPLAEALGRLELVGAICQHLATALARQGQPQEGLPYARRAVEIYTRLKISSDQMEAAQAALRDCEAGE
jgi:tetratricopeptide (TPR) repeat protein